MGTERFLSDEINDEFDQRESLAGAGLRDNQHRAVGSQYGMCNRVFDGRQGVDPP
jgi:hypothetical protein